MIFNLLFKETTRVLMNNKDEEIVISDLEFNKENLPNDYKFLVQKLKSIKETINLLEKKLFFEKEI